MFSTARDLVDLSLLADSRFEAYSTVTLFARFRG